MQYVGFPVPRKEGLGRFIAALLCALAVIAPGNLPVSAAPASSICLTGPCTESYTTYFPVVAHQRATLESLFGIQVYGQLDTSQAGLDLANQANVSWLRTQISWAAVEPVNVDPPEYRFEQSDRSLLGAVQHGIRPIATLLDNPSWAATYRNGPVDISDLEAFGRFVGAAVERYDGDGVDDAPGSPQVRYWEFYNEPDSGDLLRAEYGQGYWGNYGAEYAQMLCIAHWYAKAANPDAQIVFGGVAHDWFQSDGGPFVESFVEDALAAGAGKCFDVMNFHYYPVFASRWQSYGNGIAGKAAYFRGLLAQYGLGNKPLMCTEAGWHSDTDGLWPSSLQKQAEFAVQLFAQAKAARLLVNIWWTWMDPGSTVGSYGLLAQDGSPKLSYYAYQLAASKIGKATFSRTLSAQELGGASLEGYAFSGTPLLYVLWSNDTAVHNVRLTAAKVRVIDVYGKVISTLTDAQDGVVDGRVTVPVGSAPVYVENS